LALPQKYDSNALIHTGLQRGDKEAVGNPEPFFNGLTSLFKRLKLLSKDRYMASRRRNRWNGS